MNEKEFKQHLKQLAHGKHNLAEHDWSDENPGKKEAARKPATRGRGKGKSGGR